MSHWKAYATVIVAGALVVAPTAAHADKVWWDSLGGIDCDRETYFDTMPDGTIHHMPAMPYEIESNCGHLPTIEWGDTTGTVHIESVVPPAPAQPAAVVPAPVVAPVEPAPVQLAPDEPRQAPERTHGHTPHQRAV